jgi:hypothetical protein
MERWFVYGMMERSFTNDSKAKVKWENALKLYPIDAS